MESTINKKCVLVLGGAGYIGSHTIYTLLIQEYEVVAIDGLIYADQNNAEGDGEKPVPILRVEELTGKQVTFYNFNIMDRNRLSEVFNKVMKAHNVKRLIFSSSANVYSEPPLFAPITESHPVGQNLRHGYAKSNYFIEEIIKDLCNADQEWFVIILRYFNPVGAHPSGLIGEVLNCGPTNIMPQIAKVASGETECLYIPVNNCKTFDGTVVRDYLHIMDLAEGHVSALEKMQKSEDKGVIPINLGTGIGYTLLKVINMFSQVSKREIKYEYVGHEPGSYDYYYCDASFAKDYLGWEAKRTLKEMCEDTWRWHSLNSEGFSTTT